MAENQTQINTEKVVATLVERLVACGDKWTKSWDIACGSPRSLASGKRYRGGNAFVLTLTAMAAGYSDPRWATFNRIKKEGGNVKGQKGTPILSPRIIKDKDTGKETLIGWRLDYVWNVQQATGLSLAPWAGVAVHRENGEIHPAHQTLFGWVKESGVGIEHGESINPHYRPSTDVVGMPLRSLFHSADDYYSTLAHELAHASGAKSRFDRDLSGMGEGSYAREELVAELSALLAAGELGYEPKQAIAYLKAWLERLGGSEMWREALMAAIKEAAKVVEAFFKHLPPEDTV